MKYNYTLIIPHYNIPKLLRRLLSTVPHREDLQVIVVDDCSTKELDELANVQKKYDWVEWYSTGTNGGGGKARNIGLDHAKGKYLIFADADDYFNLCFNQLLDKYKERDFDMLYFSANIVDTETYNSPMAETHQLRIVSKFLSTYEVQDIKYRLTSPWGKLIRRIIVEKYNIRFREVNVYNDIYFSTLCDYYSTILLADITAYYCYTIRKGSVSSITTINKEYNKLTAVIERTNFLRQHKQEYSLIDPVGASFAHMIEAGTLKDGLKTFAIWHKSNYNWFIIYKSAFIYLIKHIFYLRK